MIKGTRAPDMSDLAYNDWRFNLFNKLNDAIRVSMVNRDSKKIKYNGHNSDNQVSSRFVFKPDPIYCQYSDLIIVKNVLVNRDIKVAGFLNYPCRVCKTLKQ